MTGDWPGARWHYRAMKNRSQCLARVSALFASGLLASACGGSDPAVPTYTVSGLVSGLSGTGLVLQKNGGDSLAIGANGVFTFATPLVSGATYAVTVLTQPTSPSQVCTVVNATGAVSGASVVNVNVTCVTLTTDFSIPATFNVNSTGGVLYSFVQQIDLAVDAPGAWSHRNDVKDLSLVDVTGTILALYTPTGGATGTGTVWLRPDTATTSATDVSIGTYTNQTIATGRAVIVTLVPGALTIVNDALHGSGRFKVVASGTTVASANFTVEFILHMKLNY